MMCGHHRVDASGKSVVEKKEELSTSLEEVS